MRSMICLLAVAVLLPGCGTSKNDKKDEPSPDKGAEANEAPVAAPEPAAQPPEPPPPPEEPAAAELPSSPEELELARKTAILESRYHDAVVVCSAEDQSKLDQQAVLSCVLAACRDKDSDKAGEWGKRLKGGLLKQAREVCKADNIGI